ncbi:hypothetical protein C5167_024152 [Papaver somniferum]|uniref:Uncharacterized protein n=1 Tax=Papaver somniferum TaxID=3469 RepID=A0A4Y7JRG8_PAPSO|nr:hypothetical protein C5167_024152 [Papaver somniferum]
MLWLRDELGETEIQIVACCEEVTCTGIMVWEQRVWLGIIHRLLCRPKSQLSAALGVAFEGISSMWFVA